MAVYVCSMPQPYKKLEVLAVYIHGAQRNVLVVVVYRPGAEYPTTTFIDEFADILERTSTFSSAVIILGDVNLHLDNTSNSFTVAFNKVQLQFGLIQHV